MHGFPDSLQLYARLKWSPRERGHCNNPDDQELNPLHPLLSQLQSVGGHMFSTVTPTTEVPFFATWAEKAKRRHVLDLTP
jgi:hypothetical protein